MKYSCKRILSLILSFAMITSILCSSASASTQSSEYLNAYAATITPDGGGVIVVTVNVIGRGRMKEIGAKTIYIYESADSKSFKQVATFESDEYPIMMGSGTNYYRDAATYYGKEGYYYYASVYCYAANDNGSDTKNYTTSIKQA